MDCKSIICDANNLYKAYLKTIKGSKWKETTQKFALNYLRNIFSLIDELTNQAYIPGKEGGFTLNERGKIRPITTLQPKDRVVRHIVCDEILMPKVEKKIIYDNGASIKGRGIRFTRKRFETHLHKAFQEYGTNKIYCLFGDFSKFYDNIIHEIAKEQLLELFNYDEYLDWLLTVIFENFKVDVSYLSDKEFEGCIHDIFNRLDYRTIPKKLKSKTKFMDKSVNIGDQLSQIVGIYYPNRIDTYIKHVRSMKYYGRYMDDFYLISNSKEELLSVFDGILKIANELGIHINFKKTHIERLDKPNKYLQIKYTLTGTGHVIKKINPKRVTKMEQRLKGMKRKMDSGEIPYESIEEAFRSWIGSFYKLMSKDQRLRLISLFEDLFDRKITLIKQSGKWKMLIEKKHINDN